MILMFFSSLSLENLINGVVCGSNKFYMIGPCSEPIGKVRYLRLLKTWRKYVCVHDAPLYKHNITFVLPFDSRKRHCSPSQGNVSHIRAGNFIILWLTTLKIYQLLYKTKYNKMTT